MQVHAICCHGVALVGLSLAACGCSESSPKPDSSTARADASKPKPLKYEVKIDPRSEAQQDGAAESPPEIETPTVDHATKPATASASEAPIPLNDPQAAELTMAKVVLSQAHAQTCLIGIGGSLPDLELADLDGTPQSLSKLLGQKLTVVVFWNGSQPSALQELTDLGPDVADRFSSHGVAVVGINVGDKAEKARELAKTANARFPILDDSEGTAFGQIATKKIPRTYLVDATGKTAWLDIEYSRTTRHELGQAIRFLLSHEGSDKPPTP